MNVVCKVETALVVVADAVFVWVVDILFVLLEVVAAGGGRGGTWGQPRILDEAAEVGGPRPAVGLKSPLAIGISFRGGNGKFGGLYREAVVVGSSGDLVLAGLCHYELSFTSFFFKKKKVFILIYFEVFNFNRCFGFLEGTARDFNFCLLHGKIDQSARNKIRF